MKSNIKISTFKFFILTYLVIMLIPIITCGILYSNLLQTLNRNNEDKYYSALSQSQQIVNQYLEGISNIPAQILSNRESASFLTSDIFNKGSNTYQPSVQLSIISHLNSYTSSNPLLDDIYLFSHSGDYFLSTTTAIPASSYGDFLKIGDMDYHTLKATVLSYYGYNRLYYQTDFISKGAHKNCFYFITTVPVQEAENITGAILISVDSEKLFKAIENDLPANSCFYFFDSSKNPIAQSYNSPDISLGNKKRTTTTIEGIEYTVYQTTESNSYNYALAIPSSIVSSDMNMVRFIIIFALFISFIVCGFLALYFTKKNTRPIERILNTLRPYAETSNDKNNELNIISESVDNLIITSQHSTKILEESMPILRSNFLHSILSGDLMDRDEIMQNMSQFNLSLDSSHYIICVISILMSSHNKDGSPSKVTSLKATLSEKLSSQYSCIHTYINDEQTVFLLGVDDKDNAVLILEETLNKLAEESNKEFDVKLKFAISEPFTSFFDTFYKYCDVKNVMEYGIQTSYNNAIWCTKGLSGNTGYYYPTDVEKRIIYSFQHKNIDIVYETLDTVLKENHEKRVLSAQAIKHLYSNIRCTVFKILYNLNLPPEIITETEAAFSDGLDLTLPGFFDLVKSQLTKIHSFSNDSSSENMAVIMMQYIDAHYNDPMLSRQTFSSHFHISEAYTSRFFKEYTGYQFSEYVTKVRMEAACNLLSETNITIEKISQQVGYNSDVSFRRAFKAHMGMTPKEYKVSLSNQNN